MKPNGFSLFELLVVIAIVGILAAVSIPRFADFRATAYDSRAQQDLRNLASAQELHRATNPAYAANTGDLASFSNSEGVDVTIAAADETTFSATATHPAGSKLYAWDSAAQPPMSTADRP